MGPPSPTLAFEEPLAIQCSANATPADNTVNREEEEWFDDGGESDDEDHTPIIDIPDPESDVFSDGLDDTIEQTREFAKRKKYIFPPTQEEAEGVMNDLDSLLKPKRRKGRGHKKDERGFLNGLDPTTEERMECVRMLLNTYISLEKEAPGRRGNWTTAAKRIQVAKCRGEAWSQSLRRWARDFIADKNELP
ncbi:hypothetical protein VNI00_014186 [Paramarasmius palmivorus]|uniref:HTH CENPB-type domain-containing protein n=1 Tax=Paramarasmius palmivorus TaxID=297713 RepID=A0AAW0BUE8_9AGAR